MKRIVVCLMVAAWIGSSATAQERRDILLKSDKVAQYTPSDQSLGKYYTMSVEMPAGLNAGDIRRAVLEFYMDVDVFTRTVDLFPGTDSSRTTTHTSPICHVEVFALESPISGDLDLEQLDPTLRAVSTVVSGSGQSVRLDITRIIKALAANPSANYGLVVGSFHGMREGDLTLLSGVLPDGAFARIRLN